MTADQASGTRGWRGLIIPGIAAAIVFAILISLGTWQVRRLMWKRNLIATVETRTTLEPIPLDDALSLAEAGEDLEYRPVSVGGRFLHGAEQHLYAIHGGRPGYNIYTPLERHDGSLIFINRGYVPLNRKDAGTRPESTMVETVTISGLLRRPPSEKANSFIPNHELEKNIYHWRDLSNMTAQAGLKGDQRVIQFFVDARDADGPNGVPKSGVTRVHFPNNHLQYAVTWYGAAAALVGVFFVFARRQLSGG